MGAQYSCGVSSRARALLFEDERARSSSTRPGSEPFGSTKLLLLRRYGTMSKETPEDDPRQRNDWESNKQTNEPWKGNPEKDQQSGTKKSDPDKWQETNTH
jgi:hypothetical protein